MGRPAVEPIGLHLVRAARAVSRAFDEALADAGGSLPIWLVLVSLKSGQHGTQRQIAASVGIEGPTLTHHLTRLEREGLVTRTREPGNRRVQRVELTREGDAAFFRMLDAVQAFDRRLRRGLSGEQVTATHGVLARLTDNVAADKAADKAADERRHPDARSTT